MAVYAIGDIQGCFDDFMRLLEKIDFDPNSDQLWLTGDLVNRGPKSLETLRYVKSLGEAAVTVLGNHDLHLLAVASEKRKLRRKDSLKPVLDAEDCDELLFWLRHRPLLHHDDNFCLIHAGLPPQWGFKKAKKMARKVEKILRGPDYKDFLHRMYGNKPDRWSSELKGLKRARFIVNCFTRMRYCYADGKLDFEHNAPPGVHPDHLIPWYEHPRRKTASVKIVFGHWSTLGYYEGNNCYGIDTGCLWGGQLTALRLDGEIARTSITCRGEAIPEGYF
ncbi:MAG: symmetrical bis(5'-nucleosyl)-tetraphosphatase [Gammaproteobacteria bacterium]